MKLVEVIAQSAWLWALLTSACIGTSPEEQERAAQGEAEDGNEEHRPGQPCLVCHGADYHPGGAVFTLAGTVYRSADDSDARGLMGAAVDIIDAEGREFTALTNTVGNFMIQVDTGLAEPQQSARGRLRIPWRPTFPLTVAVLYGGEDKSMESLMWREGSCAGCHRTSEQGLDHVEKIWVVETAP